MTDAAGNDGGKKGNEIPFNYDSNSNDRKSSDKVPFFNGTETAYPFWKAKMYNHNSTPLLVFFHLQLVSRARSVA